MPRRNLPQLYRDEFSNYNASKFRQDLLAGLTVAAVALPLALAFGVASGASAAAGLVTAILAGLIIGALSGAPYQISGPTGAMSAVLIVLAQQYGLTGIWLAGAIAGVLLLVIGLLRLGRFIAFVPSPVITGFTSGIALIIFIGQIDNFLGIQTPGAHSATEKLLGFFQGGFTVDWHAVVLGTVVILTMLLWPKKWSLRFPASLLGIILATVLNAVLRWPVPVIGAIPQTLLLSDRLQLGAIPWDNLAGLIAPILSITALGAVESLLCGAVASNMTGIRLQANQELIAQGVGNIVIPFFGGVPATAAIAAHQRRHQVGRAHTAGQYRPRAGAAGFDVPPGADHVADPADRPGRRADGHCLAHERVGVHPHHLQPPLQDGDDHLRRDAAGYDHLRPDPGYSDRRISVRAGLPQPKRQHRHRGAGRGPGEAAPARRGGQG